MKKSHNISRFFWAAALAAVVACLAPFPARAAKAPVWVIPVSGSISPASADFIMQNLEKAADDAAACAVIELDTPGGLLSSTKDIVQAILNCPVPVVVYVSPKGAWAASAGTFITMAADVAAMAPGTSIGAAHPVTLSGDGMGYTMTEKIVNTLSASSRSVAEQRGRNAEWAERAIRESESITANEALELKVVELVAADLGELLKKINGWEVPDKNTIQTQDAPIVRVEGSVRDKILDKIADPNVAYILLMIGLAGIVLEIYHPGTIFPGVLGGICLLLAAYSFQFLPVNWTGVLLIVLAVVFFVLEAQIASYGVLSLGGIIALILGSLMLFQTGETGVRVAWSVLAPTVAIISGTFILALTLVVKAQKRRPISGNQAMVGKRGEVKTGGPDKGKVFVHGELWNARFAEPLSPGDEVEVIAVDGLFLTVKKS